MRGPYGVTVRWRYGEGGCDKAEVDSPEHMMTCTGQPALSSEQGPESEATRSTYHQLRTAHNAFTQPGRTAQFHQA
jgi:hypothetical protein